MAIAGMVQQGIWGFSMIRNKKTFCFLFSVLLLMIISITAPVYAARISKRTLTLNVGETYRLKVKGTKKKIKWKSSNKAVASVTSKGKVKGKAKGICKITAKVGKKKYTCKVTVTQSVQSLKFNSDTLNLYVGKKAKLSPLVYPDTIEVPDLAWHSSNSSVAIVSSIGEVYGLSAGTATIIAMAMDGSGKRAQCIVKVSENPSSSTTSTGNTDPLEPMGCFYEQTGTWKYGTENGFITFNAPKEAKVILKNKDRVVFRVKKPWIHIETVVEVDHSIHSEPACELKVREITSSFSTSTFQAQPYADSTRSALTWLPYNYVSMLPSSVNSTDCDMRNVWYMNIGSNGAAYFHESASYTSVNDFVYSEMLSESYNYVDSVTIHTKTEVFSFDYATYYNSFQTTIEKNWASEEYDKRNGFCISSMYYRSGKTYTDFASANSISDCLFSAAKLMK